MLKLQIKYEDAGGLVPWEIHIYFITEEGEESDTYKVRSSLVRIYFQKLLFRYQVVPVGDNSASVEFTVSNEEHIQMRLYRRGQFQLFLVSFKCITCVVLTLLYSAHVHLIHK